MIIKIKQAITNIHIHRDTIHNNKIWIKVAPNKKRKTKRNEKKLEKFSFDLDSVQFVVWILFLDSVREKKRRRKFWYRINEVFFPSHYSNDVYSFFFLVRILFFLERWVGGGKRIQNFFFDPMIGSHLYSGRLYNFL